MRNQTARRQYRPDQRGPLEDRGGKTRPGLAGRRSGRGVERVAYTRFPGAVPRPRPRPWRARGPTRRDATRRPFRAPREFPRRGTAQPGRHRLAPPALDGVLVLVRYGRCSSKGRISQFGPATKAYQPCERERDTPLLMDGMYIRPCRHRASQAELHVRPIRAHIATRLRDLGARWQWVWASFPLREVHGSPRATACRRIAIAAGRFLRRLMHASVTITLVLAIGPGS